MVNVQDDCVIIDLSDVSDVSWSSDEQEQLIYDSYSIEQDDREEILLPKVNVKNMYTSKSPSITDLYCRKRQVALFKKRDESAELVWQYHVLISSCDPAWSCIHHLKMMFYVILYRQRAVELSIINLQIQKGMVGIQENDLLYPTVVICYNNVNHFSNGKMNDYQPMKSDNIKTLTSKLDKLLFTLEQLLKMTKEVTDFQIIENNAKRLSLLIININKIIIVM